MTATYAHGRIHIKGGCRCAVAKVGHKWAHIVFIYYGNRLKTKRVRKDRTRYFRPLPGYDNRATLAEALMSGRSKADMPKAAHAILTEATTAD